MDARLSLRRSLGSTSSFTLSYSYNLEQGGTWPSYDRQRLDANLYASKGQKWYGYSFASYDLTNKSIYGSLSCSYQLPIERISNGRSKWRLDLRSSFSRFMGLSQTDARIALGRDIGNYEILLCYSPTGTGYGSYGYGYGTRQGKKWWLELAAAGFR